MDPNLSGWLRKFCDSVSSSQLKAEKPLLPGYEPTLYKTIQPSGLMYGHPVKEIGEMQFSTDRLDPVSRMKLVYIESLMVTGRLRLDENVSVQDQSGVVEQLVPEISEYLLNLYPGLYQGNSSYLSDPYRLTETLIAKRVRIQTSLVKNHLASLFHNSLLFLDVYYFGEWVNSFGTASVGYLKDEQDNLRLTILGIMALAAHADHNLQKEERALFEFYLESANLSSELQKEARLLLTSVRSLGDVDIPHIDSWLVRKYLIEMALLVTLADREISQPEQDFIDELGERLGFSASEIAESKLAVESFVLSNWSEMHYLVGKNHLDTIRHRFVVRLKGFVSKNKDHVVQEIRESKELFYLLGKSRTTALTEVEKKIVNEQLIDILKTIPAFVIIALPFTFITLPTLLAILPKNAFPSAFQE